MGRRDVPVEYELRSAVGPAGQPRARTGFVRHPEPRLQPATGIPGAPGPAAGDQEGAGALGCSEESTKDEGRRTKASTAGLRPSSFVQAQCITHGIMADHE